MGLSALELMSAALKQAQLSANSYKEIIDSGTCNLDTVIYNFTGWRQSAINDLQNKSGIRIGSKMTGFNAGHRFIFFEVSGQALQRNMMVEAAKSKLCELGYESAVWYQMD